METTEKTISELWEAAEMACYYEDNAINKIYDWFVKINPLADCWDTQKAIYELNLDLVDLESIANNLK